MQAILALSQVDSLRWLAVGLDAAAKGLLLLAVAAGATQLLRRGSAAARHMVWTLGVVGLLCVPVLSVALPQWQVPVLPDWTRPAETAPDPAPVQQPASGVPCPYESSRKGMGLPDPPTGGETGVDMGLLADETGAAMAEPSDPSESGAAFPPEKPGAPQEAGLPAPPVAAVASTAPTLHWATWALAIWAAGIALLAAPLLLGTVLAWWQTRRARPVTDPEWTGLLAGLSTRLGVRRTVSLRKSAGPSIPATCGILRPAIVLPAEADDWSPQRRAVVLLHELAHVKRADCLTQLIARLARVLYWFNPMVWLAGRMLRVERERACDDLVLASGHKPSDYAAHLLEIVRTLHSARCPSLAAVAMARRSQFEGRMLAILDGRRNRRALTRLGTLVAVILVMGVVVPISLIKATAADKPPASATQPTGTALQSDPANLHGPVLLARKQYRQGQPMELRLKWDQSLNWAALTERDANAPPGDMWWAQAQEGRGSKYWFIRVNGKEYRFKGSATHPEAGWTSPITPDVVDGPDWLPGQYRVQYLAKDLPVRMLKGPQDVLRAALIASNEVEFEIVPPSPDPMDSGFTFGEAREETLSRQRPMLNLASGNIIRGKPRFNRSPNPDQDELAWLAANDVDLELHEDPTTSRQKAILAIRMQVGGGLWESATPSAIRDVLELAEASGRTLLAYPQAGWERMNPPLPRTVAFRTHAGQMGLLQLLSIDANVETVKLRWKLLAEAAPAAASRPAAQPALAPGARLVTDGPGDAFIEANGLSIRIAPEHPVASPATAPTGSHRFVPSVPPGAALEPPAGAAPPMPADLAADEQKDYVIGPTDILDISVMDLFTVDVETVLRREVSDSGHIALPLLANRIKAQGRTQQELKEDIVKAYIAAVVIKNPIVSVTIVQGHWPVFSILGAVPRPGVYAIPRGGLRLLEALALSGGMNQETGRNWIYVIRAVPTGAKASAADRVSEEQKDYLIGPTDIVDISIMALFTEGAETALRREVSDSGHIDLPKLKEQIKAQGRTQHQLKADIAKAYSGAGVLKNPTVNVTIVQRRSSSAPAAVAATGPAPAATRLIAIDLRKLNEGDAKMNVVIRDGDVIMVPQVEAGEFYVMGDVERTGVYSLTGRRITVKMALASAGKPAKGEWPEKSVLIRRVGENKEETLPLNVKAIVDGKESDLFLQADDVLIVGSDAQGPALSPIRTQIEKLKSGSQTRPAAPPDGLLEKEPNSGRAYRLLLPPQYDANKAWPLVVSCHGTAPYDSPAMHIRELAPLAAQNGWIVLAPDLAGTDGILGDGKQVVEKNQKEMLAIIEAVAGKYNIDRANVLLTGFSGGGLAVYGIGLRHPETFSCLVLRGGSYNPELLPKEFSDTAKKLPILIYYGEDDPAMIVEQSKQAAKALKGAGLSLEEKVLTGMGHERHPEVAAAFFQGHRNPARPSLAGGAAIAPTGAKSSGPTGAAGAADPRSATQPVIGKREINKSLADLPEGVDLATPEGLWTALTRACLGRDANVFVPIYWEEIDPALYSQFWRTASPADIATYEYSLRGSKLIEVLSYKDLAFVVARQAVPEGNDPGAASIRDMPCAGLLVLELSGRWKILQMVRGKSTEDMEDKFDNRKDEYWRLGERYRHPGESSPGDEPAGPARNPGNLTGSLVKVEGNTLIIDAGKTRRGQAAGTFVTDANTRVNLDYEPAKLTDLKPGMTIVAQDNGRTAVVSAHSAGLFGKVVRVEGKNLIVAPESPMKLVRGEARNLTGVESPGREANQVTVVTDEKTKVILLEQTQTAMSRSGVSAFTLRTRAGKMEDIKPDMSVTAIPETGMATKIIARPPWPADSSTTQPDSGTAVPAGGAGTRSATQPAGAAAPAAFPNRRSSPPVVVLASPPSMVIGTLLSVEGNSLVLNTAPSGSLQKAIVDIDDQTRFLVDWEPGSLADLKPDMRITVTTHSYLRPAGDVVVVSARSKSLTGAVVKVEGNSVTVRVRPAKGEPNDVVVGTDEKTRIIFLDPGGTIRVPVFGPRGTQAPPGKQAPSGKLEDIKPDMPVEVIPETGTARKIIVTPPRPPAGTAAPTSKPQVEGF